MINKIRFIYWDLIGRDISSFMKEKYETKNITKEKLESVQFEKLKKILLNAYKNVPYYTEEFDKIGFNPKNLKSISEFNELDFYIDKENVRENTEKLISLQAKKKKLSWHRTGGSTGTPLYFATDKLTDSGSQTSIMRSLEWFGTKFGRKHVIFWGSPSYVVRTKLDYLKTAITKIRDKLMSRMYISNYDLSPENMEKYFYEIERYQPEYIRGMASSLYLFSKYIVDNNLIFNNTKLKVIHSACEQLFDWQKEVIEKAFNAPVANTYGLSEVCDIAYGAPCGHLHISDEDVLVQLKDTDKGKEIVVTQLNNLYCPLIKYRTGDLAENINDDCSAIKTKYIEGIKGRSHDVIKTKDGKYVHGQAFTHVLVFIENIYRYQLVQLKLDEFKILLVVSDSFIRDFAESEIVRGVRKLVGDDAVINFEYVNEIPLTPSGKHRWIISNV